MTRRALVHALAVVATLGMASKAAAYPHFQLSTGSERCSSCHYSPAGGGLLNGYGRYESGETVSRENFPWASGPAADDDIKFLHGLVDLPGWIDFGGDFRGAVLTNKVSGDTDREWLVIPMQADLYGRVRVADFSANATVGLRGFARPKDAPASSYVVSREHYLMWAPGDFYVRAGRFMPLFGLRLADHTAYVRRYLGLNLLEESYGAGAGYVVDRWEVHATGFSLNPLRAEASDERGAALYSEARAGPTAWGGSFRFGDSESARRLTGGLTGKVFLEPLDLVFLGEADLTHQTFAGVANGGRNQLATYAGLVYRPWRGVYLGGAYELFDEDLAVRDVERHGLGLWLAYHPRAHFELLLASRYQFVGPEDQASVAMLMLHYYL
jgi:hypothetical protein